MGNNKKKSFESDLADRFGEEMRVNDDFCKEIWSSLANIIWKNGDEEFSCTFRYGGSLVASISEKGDYMNWYCSGPYATVSDKIKKGMAKDGWKPFTYPPHN